MRNLTLTAQDRPAKAAPGLITGNVIDPQQKAIADATVTLRPLTDSLPSRNTRTDKNGNFEFENLNFGLYRLTISFVSFRPLTLDSIHIRSERYDFNLSDLTLKPNTDSALEEVVVYAEKPLIQSKDGNITFNAGESALSAGSNAAELLKNVPLVANDPDGKIVVRGKEPKILIDDKPVELNAQQLADLLESLPGSMIEKIEVMTNPPPQYANEQGGVINIVTRKGKVGVGARLTLTAGTRGEYGASGNINYRKKGLSVNFNMGFAYNEFDGNGYSKRQNFNKTLDTITSYNNSLNNNHNKGIRPNARLSIDYEVDKRNAFNLAANVNQSITRNSNFNEYTNLNRNADVYRNWKREIANRGDNISPVFNLTYTHKGKKPGETLRVIAGANFSNSSSDRTWEQQTLFPVSTITGPDSSQQIVNGNRNTGLNLRVNYDKMLDNKKTTISTGGAVVSDLNRVDLTTRFRDKNTGEYILDDRATTDFRFRQTVSNIRVAVKQLLTENFSVTAGVTAEAADLGFSFKNKTELNNKFFTWLPFTTFSKKFGDVLNINLSYRKTVRRPGIAHLNPNVDSTDPNNHRFGNPGLQPTISHNFDLVFGRTTDKYYTNLGFGYNQVKGNFSQIRNPNPLDSGVMDITWFNIDDRHEYEVSSWSGYTFSKALRINLSVSYTYNRYSSFDRERNKYRDGGSLTSNFNGNYVPTDVWNFTTGITYNRFANPQGTVRSNLRMNLGVQRKLFKKKLVITFNVVDPIAKQEYHSFTYGATYNQESFSSTNTRNFRLTVGYNFTQLGKSKKKPAQSKKK
ncbi:outer membrane beta-barrel protein [Pseudoflavitalea sp. G-6-1-2]|uniref:outer membrane beta-barrel protein n=1 Tax=Pseudoflavitalea sp. G-6-1-2 TaxID=2728841 RepID=UPI00146C7D7F|nr:outer membrane beta-barrel protein [Pseudoflavitalea sp. G-6-1-2]NML23658.1 outer membrane beta-barrel protein [Pseudoflavitalea sp. G-6-1-2]